jgi:hypothetical protein
MTEEYRNCLNIYEGVLHNNRHHLINKYIGACMGDSGDGACLGMGGRASACYQGLVIPYQAGPFGSEETARAVETALISAIEPFCNQNAGETRWRFRHHGIPEHFSHRLLEPMLTRSDFVRAQSVPHSPVLFVRVGEQTFDDGRVGYDPANPPSDKQILDRINRWWQLGPHVNPYGEPAKKIRCGNCWAERQPEST